MIGVGPVFQQRGCVAWVHHWFWTQKWNPRCLTDTRLRCEVLVVGRRSSVADWN